MLRKSVDKPINQPNTINIVDVIKLEHDTRKGKGGLHNSTLIQMHNRALVCLMINDTVKEMNYQ